MDEKPRNPKTGSLDLNDDTVYTGFAECPIKEIARVKLWLADGSIHEGLDFSTVAVPIVYGIAEKKDGSFFFIEGHEHYFFSDTSIGFSNAIAECSGNVVTGHTLEKGAYDAKVAEAVTYLKH